MTPKNKVIEVAEYFIKRSQEESDKDATRKIDALKLQKLLYYAKVWNIVLNNGNRLYNDEIQAWVHGPVVATAYYHFQNFDFSVKHPEITEVKFESITDKEKEILDIVWNAYGKFDGKYLETLTHSEEPWLQARAGLGQKDISQNVISDDSIKSYYERQFQEATRATETDSK